MHLYTASPVPDSPPGVIVCYAHDDESKWAVPILLDALRPWAFDVVSDLDLPRLSPLSMQGWMDEEIRARIVVCWLSADFVAAFESNDDTAGKGPPRLGLRYESRAIRQKIYYHTKRFGCPVIPVALPGFPAEQAPDPLRPLEIERFDPETGLGVERLANRISAVAGVGGARAMTAASQMKPTAGERTFRRVVHELEAVDPQSGNAVELVRECLRMSQDRRYECELPKAFSAGERVIKAVGDIGLMRMFSGECLRVLRLEPQLRSDREMEARVMICAEGWYLLREHRVQDALRVTEDGVKLAEKSGDHKTAAFGYKHLGRIRRLLAQEARGVDRDYQLRLSEESLVHAIQLFTAIHGGNCDEVGACVTMQARTQLARYRVLHDAPALKRASELAEHADDLLSPACGRDYFDLLILFAEIALLGKRNQHAKDLITRAIERIASPNAAQISEVLGRAYLLRAKCVMASRGNKVDAMRDLNRALDTFQALGQVQAVARCEWEIVKVEPSAITNLKITSTDIHDIEALTLDYQTRMRAVKNAQRRFEQRAGGRQNHRTLDWAHIVDRAAHED